MKNFALILAAALLVSSCGYTKSDKSYSSNKVHGGNPERSISSNVSTVTRVQADNYNTVRSAAEAARNIKP